jgi:hypothetical protein
MLYQVTDSTTNQPQLRREMVFVMRHALYRFECRFLKTNNSRAEAEAERFFTSIEVRN